ncbi:MAG TPA: M48 family metallopeptidase [Candidatus Acidoferrales bacterium]|nr:M48 family metallopeptidase [Candidatus Acidoferrales bacterium]
MSFSSRSALIVLAAIAVLFAVAIATPAGAGAETAGASAEATASAAPASAATPAQAAVGYRLTKEQYAKAVAYSRAGYRLYFIGVVYNVLLLVAILYVKFGARLRDLAERASRVLFVQVAIVVSVLTIVLAILQLPLSTYSHWLALRYDQSVQAWPSWLWDVVKGQLIAIILSSIAVFGLYAIMRRSRRRWWLYFWIVSLPITLFMVVIEPIFIAPLFNKFEPLNDKQPALVAQIEKVVVRGGLMIPPSRMYEMKASEKTRVVNAYVTGFGPSQRVVVFDNAIAKMTPDEILFVFGHEMGHYVLHHILKEVGFQSLIFLVGLYCAYLWIGREVRVRGTRWGIRSVDDLASLPALMLFAAVAGFVTTPLVNGYSRHCEHQADIFGLEVTHSIVPDSPEVASQAFQILGEVDLSDPAPGPLIKFWLYNHPALDDRIRFAHSYDPWSSGTAPEFIR